MSTQSDSGPIAWHMHLASSPEDVYQMIATDRGRSRFWAESAEEVEGHINFRFPNGASWQGKILDRVQDKLFRIEYYGGTLTTFVLESDGAGGTELMLTDEGVPSEERPEVVAGWVSVLLALKAAVDFNVDIRNHHPNRTWDQGYAEN